MFLKLCIAWEQRELGKVGTFTSNGVDKLSKPDEVNVNLLNYMDVYNCKKIDDTNCHSLMQVTAKPIQIKNNNIECGDVFFTPTSETAEDIGHVLVIEKTLPNTVYSYHLMRYRPNQKEFFLTYPNYGFDTNELHKQMSIKAKGVQRFVISKPDFESLVVTVPNYEEQKKIAELLTNLDNLITLHQCLLINEIITLSNPISPLIIVSLPYLAHPLPESKYLTRKTDNLEKTIKNNQKQTKSLKYRVSHPYSYNRVFYRTLQGNRVKY